MSSVRGEVEEARSVFNVVLSFPFPAHNTIKERLQQNLVNETHQWVSDHPALHLVTEQSKNVNCLISCAAGKSTRPKVPEKSSMNRMQVESLLRYSSDPEEQHKLLILKC